MVCWVTKEIKRKGHFSKVDPLVKRHTQYLPVESERCVGIADTKHGLIEYVASSGGILLSNG